MAKLLRHLRWIVMLGVAGLVLASAAAFVAGILDVVSTARGLLEHEAGANVRLVHAIDLDLIAASAFMVAVGLFEIFIGPVDVPETLRSHGFGQLKSKLIGLLVLILAVDFVQDFVAGTSPRETLERAIAGAIFVGALVAFLRWGSAPRQDVDHESS
jgi:uncharacterized membrane protein YqhA